MSAPSTFADFAALPGVGVAWYVNVSLDNFATQFKNYSSVAMQLVAGGTMYDPRILSIGNLTRAFGASRGFASGTCSLELDNTDGGCDWLVDRATYATQTLRAKFELYVVLYDPQQAGLDLTNSAHRAVKQLGTFMMMDPPSRDAAKVSISLADDSLGEVATLHRTPSIRDWMKITDPDRPEKLTEEFVGAPTGRHRFSMVPGFDFDAPVQLLFGSNALPVKRVMGNCYVICAVAGSAGSLGSGIRKVLLNNGQWIAAELSNGDPDSPEVVPIYTVHRTPDIDVDGRTYHLLWLDLDLTASYEIGYPLSSGGLQSIGIRGYLTSMGYDPQIGEALWEIHDQVAPVMVIGWLLSHPDDSEVDELQAVHGATVVQDLLTYYARRENVAIDTTSFNSVRAARPNFIASGAIDDGFEQSIGNANRSFSEIIDGSLLKALRGICEIGAFDLFVDWSGNIRATAMISDYDAQTVSIATLSEEDLLNGTSEKIPSVGERNAPHNQIYFSAVDGRFGPYNDEALLTAWGKSVSVEIDAHWLAREDLYALAFNGPRRPLISKTPYDSTGSGAIRPVVTCRTMLNGLNFELGDYIYFTWSRGTLGGPYVNSTFRVEGITLDPMSCTVELTLLWVDDLRSTDNLPYLLDDETLNLRASGSGGRTATVTAGSDIVTFSSGNLTSDGVLANDNLVIHDAAEAIDAFARNQQYRVKSVDSATQLTLTSAVGGSGSHVLSVWELLAGALTYRANAVYFGKTVDSNGFFSDGTTVGNKLLEG